MVKVSKGLMVAAAVAAGLSLAGCASQGSSACGDTTATPVAAPAPMPVTNACKNSSSCKAMVKKHKHVKHHKHSTSSTTKTTSTTTTSSADGSKDTGTAS